MKVNFGKGFNDQLKDQNVEDLKKILTFVEYVTNYGLSGNPGLNKKSDNVNENYHLATEMEIFAQKHKLWHYHVGIPHYNTTKGIRRYTSEKVIHYQRYPDSIKLVLLGDHSPFRLPQKYQLEHLI